jgi:type I restriction enzyme M protein
MYSLLSVPLNLFAVYTRTVPCELWFLNHSKPEVHRDKVLMIDARNIYRKVTRKIYDFNPEQQQNLLAIVWLYRGQTGKYLDMFRAIAAAL